MTQTNDANAILMGGGGSPAWKFDGPGVRKVAKIVSPPTSRQEREYDPNNPGGGALKVFPSGDPIMGVLVEVQTDERDPSKANDDGKRTFFIEGKRLKDAVRAGVRNAGAPGLEVGGALDVALTHYDDGVTRQSGCNWQVSYSPAAVEALMGDTAPVTQVAPAAPAPAQAGPSAEQLAAFAAWQQSQQQPA